MTPCPRHDNPIGLKEGFDLVAGALSVSCLESSLRLRVVRPGWSTALVILPIAIGCGLLAARFGDAFWRYVIEAFRWFV